MTAKQHCGEMVTLEEIDTVNFYAPVTVGQILQLRALVIYTKPKTGQVCVKVLVKGIDPERGEDAAKVTNEMHMTFKARSDVPEVIPVTYEESLTYLKGYRRLQNS